MAALHRAIAFAQIHDIAVHIGQHLDFDVARIEDVFFDKKFAVFKGGFSFTAGAIKCCPNFGGAVGDFQAASAAARAGLDRDGIAVFRAQMQRCIRRFHRAGCAGNQRNIGSLRHLSRRNLAAHLGHRADGWANKYNPSIETRLGKISIFGQKAITRMDRARASSLGNRNNRFDKQITLAGGRWPKQEGIVGVTHMQRCAVGFGIHRDGAKTKFFTGSHHPQGNFAAIGDQHSIKRHCFVVAPSIAVISG